MDRTYDIVTERLRLHALSLEETRLLARGDRVELGARLGARVPAEWPDGDLAGAMPLFAEEMERQATDERWVWPIIEQATATVVGDIGFHHPVAGVTTIEMGYALLPAWRERGYMTEAGAALLAWAFTQTAVERVTVKIAPENARSLRVAAKLGMREIASDEPEFRAFERLRPPG